MVIIVSTSIEHAITAEGVFQCFTREKGIAFSHASMRKHNVRCAHAYGEIVDQLRQQVITPETVSD
jgi:hypothetical protein